MEADSEFMLGVYQVARNTYANFGNALILTAGGSWSSLVTIKSIWKNRENPEYTDLMYREDLKSLLYNVLLTSMAVSGLFHGNYINDKYGIGSKWLGFLDAPIDRFVYGD